MWSTCKPAPVVASAEGSEVTSDAKDLGTHLIELFACRPAGPRSDVQEAGLADAWSLDAEVHTFDLGEVRRYGPGDPMSTAIRQLVEVFA